MSTDEEYNRDIEQGPPNYERVVLLIDGLQSGCCDSSISRAVARIPSVQSHQVNVVLARLELLLDTTSLSVAEVIAKLSSQTGYNFEEHVVATGQVLDLLATDAKNIQYAGTPFGIKCVDSPEKQSWNPSRILSGRNTFICFLRVLVLTLPVLVLAWTPVDHTKLLYAHVSFGLATLVQAIAIWEFSRISLRSLWHSWVFEMDLLVVLSSTLAYAFGVVSYIFQIYGKPLETGSFFETSTLLVTLILLGRVINEFACYKAAKSVSFRSLQTDQALLVLPSSKNVADCRTQKIDARLLQYGDQFKVAPYKPIVTDGVILYGGSEVDETMITGESIPVAKGVHSKVFAGTTNGGGTLVVKLTALPHENSVHKIAAMVEDAKWTKPNAQALADRIAGWFVPVMAAIGLLVFMIWLFVDQESWILAAVQATACTIATLVVSCPGAIALAVPIVTLIAGGVAARFGIILRDPQSLEVARHVTDVVFDKTGILTCGVLTVVDEEYYNTPAVETKAILLSLFQNTNHHVAVSIRRHLERKTDPNSHEHAGISNVTGVPSCGVYGTYSTSKLQVCAGNPDWLHLSISDSRYTLLCVTIGGTHAATFKLKDRPRHTANMVIQKLHARGIETHMISGDSEGAVNNTAHTLAIPKRNTKWRCNPSGKCTYIRDLQRPGRVVMFVGDALEDLLALEQADIGVYMKQTTTAKGVSDVILMTARLHTILILLDISRAAYRRIILSFIWAAVYNVAAILLAAGAFTALLKHARIRPEDAGLGELISVLPVVLVAVQMRWRDYGVRYREIEYDFQKVGE
ncbi:E1-E2 ATPase-domain-containing protein [Phaeosphaeriaceae sp. PMI808]|nr:E1-E2 ATPase-domain-containing protein [Phaeosphaeriaceae sp. PMI808]